eukprot:355158-Chlamydomonas_euryale.AAC.9
MTQDSAAQIMLLSMICSASSCCCGWSSSIHQLLDPADPAAASPAAAGDPASLGAQQEAATPAPCSMCSS